jgi:uncharacterized protein YyaL (SSP411 family)
MTHERKSQAHVNRLIEQTSPYLLQHAHNPVDWFPWGEEAFARARQEDKPVFLSIGYSTCHWCHVMERESFEDEATAAILNEHFISIKVDREELPDIDDAYMKLIQLMTGSGGWPLSVFMTADGWPFYGGTYFPPQELQGRPGFRQVLHVVAQTWREGRDELLDSAGRIVDALKEVELPGAPMALSEEILGQTVTDLMNRFDGAYGGFGDAPKFPQPGVLSLLLRWSYRSADTQALEMVTKTLDAMMAGGLYDHLGGGFHRYSTDAQWKVPHFEKMLYDQAMLAIVYTHAYQVTGRDAYAAVAGQTLDYVLRDMTDPGGGFYAAEDADSEGREGAFYLWQEAQIEAVFRPQAARLFARRFGVTPEGNFEDGRNILHIARTVEQLSEEFGMEPQVIGHELTAAVEQLRAFRNTRPRPERDDKIITAWNGLMISALSIVGTALEQPRYVEAAQKAARFVLDELRIDGGLMRYHRDGHAVTRGFLDDYACLVAGLMDLYEASFDPHWLEEAVALAGRMMDLFEDKDGHGFFMTDSEGESLIVREKPYYDGAVPSGNAVAALSLQKLGRITSDERFSRAGRQTLEAFSESMSQSAVAMTAMLGALDYWLSPGQEVVIASAAPSPSMGLDAEPMVAEVRRHFLPHAIRLFHPPASEPAATEIERIAPFTSPLVPIEGRTAVYICKDRTCQPPVTEVHSLRAALSAISKEFSSKSQH